MQAVPEDDERRGTAAGGDCPAAGGEIILADEPTGNLDSGNEENVVALLKELSHEDGYTVIVITHNQRVADETDHVFRMKDGSMEQIR